MKVSSKKEVLFLWLKKVMAQKLNLLVLKKKRLSNWTDGDEIKRCWSGKKILLSIFFVILL
ncbi:hypothetical protein CBF29_08740 [Vagococcus elongatus]|uniref:Uncharacterized protein n=1 Tax=Vagococcus elongatus TaxID=180344 RepID=A0A430ASK2_9ENTE|nr:hypothetical protein CBF29_08740 [Vagococcus elongatus]